MKNLVSNVQLEFLKLRRQHIWLVMIIAVPLLINFAKAGENYLSEGFSRSFYGAPLYNAVLMPILCATVVSRICENEYEGSAFKQLLTVQKPSELFHAKFVTAALLMAVLACVEPLTLAIAGKMFHYTDSASTSDILFFGFSQYLVCIFLVILVQIISLYSENQFVPMSVGVVLSLLGLFSMFFPVNFMRFIPSSYFALLSFVGMNWDKAAGTTTFYRTDYAWGYVIALVVVSAVLYVISLRWFAGKEN